MTRFVNAPGDQRGSDDREHHLVGDQHDERDPRRRVHREWADVAQEREVEVAVDPVGAAAEAERIADQPPEHRRDPHRGEALDHDRERVRPPDESAVEEREPRRHQHHQTRCEKHEAGVRSVDHECVPSTRARISGRGPTIRSSAQQSRLGPRESREPHPRGWQTRGSDGASARVDRRDVRLTKWWISYPR